MIARLQQRYREEIVPKLREEFSYANPHQIPSVSKVVINVGMGEATQNSKLLDKAMEELAAKLEPKFGALSTVLPRSIFR